MDLLEKKNLLKPELIRDLRRRVARAGTPVEAAVIAQRLIDKGQLSKTLAKQSLQQAMEAASSEPPPTSEPDEPELGLVPLEEEQEDDFGLIPLDEETDEPDIGASEENDWGLTVVDDEPRKVPVEPVKDGSPPPAAVGGAPGKKAAQTSEPPRSLAAELAFDDHSIDVAALEAKPQQIGSLGYRGAKKSVWDSNLLLFGFGGLLVLAIILTVIVWSLMKRNPEEMLNLANELYRGGSYTKAADLYDEYLKRYSEKTGSNSARIMLGLARMRQATSEGRDWPIALEVSKRELERIAGGDMTEARAELAAMLPDIADGLSQLAKEECDPAIVEMTEDALNLVDKHIPSSSRPVTRLANIRAVLDLTRREIARGEKLQEAISAMKEAVSEGKTEQAYMVRRTLLKEYPGLIEDSGLRAAVLAVSEADFGLVKVVREERKSMPAKQDATTPAALALVKRTTNGTVSGADGRVVFAVAEGAAYGLDAASGKVLWRRHVGFASDGRGTSLPATAVSGAEGSNCVLVNWEDSEVLQLQAATGATEWRFPVGERFDAHPVAIHDQLLVATRSGRLFVIDVKSGTASSYVQLPRELRVAPVAQPNRDSIYLIGEHSNLFVLSLESGEAKQVVYLGHEPGSVVCPPVLIGSFLVVAVNDGIESSTLNVLALGTQDDQQPVRLTQQKPIQGHVSTSPSVSGPRMLVASDQGDIHVFELSGDDKENPLGLIAEGKSPDDGLLGGNESLIRFPFLIGGQAWVADSQLTRYDVQAARGLLQDKWVQNSGSPTLQPPMAFGETICYVRRKLGMPGVLVAALDVGEGNTVWETQLAAPLVSEPWIDSESGQVMAVSRPGAVFSIAPEKLDGKSVDVQPTAALPPTAVRRPLTDAVPLGGETVVLVITDGPDEIRIFDPQSPGTRFRSLQLASSAACRPAVFADGLLIPVTGGQTLFLDSRNGSNRTEPFQPPLKTGIRVAWKEPVPGPNGEIILTDGVTGLYRVKIEDDPKPHLSAVASTPLEEPITSPIALLGGTIHAVDKSQSLISFGLPDLKPGKPRPLAAGITWGPRTVGDHVLLTTDDELLYSIDTQGEVRTGKLPYGSLAGMPISVNDHLVFASTGGVIWKINAATGEELGSVDIKCHLQTGPVLLGERLLVGGRDGSLYRIEKP